MTRLISADLLKARIEKARRDVCGINDDDDNWLVNLAADGMIKQIDETPTVDAIPVAWIEQRMEEYSEERLYASSTILEVLIIAWKREKKAE